MNAMGRLSDVGKWLEQISCWNKGLGVWSWNRIMRVFREKGKQRKWLQATQWKLNQLFRFACRQEMNPDEDERLKGDKSNFKCIFTPSRHFNYMETILMAVERFVDDMKTIRLKLLSPPTLIHILIAILTITSFVCCYLKHREEGKNNSQLSFWWTCVNPLSEKVKQKPTEH